MDLIELKVLVDLLFYSTVFKWNNEDLNSIFATDSSSQEIFKCVLLQKGFQVLLIAMRFDDQNTRAERKHTDKLAPVSSIFNLFV